MSIRAVARRLPAVLLGAALHVDCGRGDIPHAGVSDADATGDTGSTASEPGSLSATVTSAASGDTSVTGDATGDGEPTSGTTDGSTGEVCADCPCDPFGGDCPSGQKCVAYATGNQGWDATRCVDVTGSDEPGDPCTSEGIHTGLDSCVEGAMCWDFARSSGPHLCVAHCTGSFDDLVCGPGTSSYTIGFGAGCLCLPSCDPLVQDCVDPGDGCYPWNYPHLFCRPHSLGEVGQIDDPCTFPEDCEPGLTCVAAEVVGTGCVEGSAACCTPFCQVPQGSCPDMGQQCLPYYASGDLVAGDWRLDLGVCLVPE